MFPKYLACILEFIATSKRFLILIRAFQCAVNIGRMTIEGLDFEAEREHKENTWYEPMY